MNLFIPSTQEVKAGESLWVQDSQDYIEKYCLKNPKTKQNQNKKYQTDPPPKKKQPRLLNT